MTACIEAIATFDGELPAVVQRGWGRVSDIKPGLKKRSESKAAASFRNIFSQKEITFFLTMLLYVVFVGGFPRSSLGGGDHT